MSMKTPLVAGALLFFSQSPAFGCEYINGTLRNCKTTEQAAAAMAKAGISQAEIDRRLRGVSDGENDHRGKRGLPRRDPRGSNATITPSQLRGGALGTSLTGPAGEGDTFATTSDDAAARTAAAEAKNTDNKNETGVKSEYPTDSLNPAQAIAELEQRRQQVLKQFSGLPERERYRSINRINEFFNDVRGSLENNPGGNKGLKFHHLDIVQQFIVAERNAERLYWRSRRDPTLTNEFETAKQKAQELMNRLHPHNEAGGLAFHEVLMLELENDGQGPRIGRDRDSIRDWAAQNPNFPGAQLGLGRTHLEEGNPAAALEAFDRALALERSGPAFSGRAAAQFALGNIQAAYDDARAALELDPDDKAAFATMKLAEGRGAGPRGVDAKQDGGGDSQAGGGKGRGSGFAGGSRADVASLLTQQLPPGASEARRYNEKAASALRVGDHAAALDAADRALKAYSANPFPHLVRARVYSDQAQWKRALGSSLEGLKVAPNDKSLLRARAYAANRGRDRLAAMEAANALLENEQSAYAMANLAYARGLNGDRDGMLEALRRAARQDPAFESSLESALQMPDDADMLFLFPGEAPTEQTLKALNAAGHGPHGKKSRFGMLALGSLLGGALIGLGLLSSMIGPALTKVRSAFTDRRSPAVTAMRSTDREHLATLEPPSVQGHVPGVLRGQYKLKRQIGMGGMGMVFEGEDVTLGRRVAIKKMRDEIRLDRRERQRFVNEAKMVAALHHANIVDIYAIVEENDDVYLVFEYVTGRTVHELIGQKGALSWREAMGIFRGMSAALDFAHQRNIVHRDLKPSNVMIDDEGYVKVMDFGIARAAKDVATRASVMMTNTIVGTPPYMAPEQEQGLVRKESDVYALAICLYEMLTGKMPFVGTGGGMLMNKINMSYVKASAMVDGLPAGIDDVFAKAFQADPDKRFHSSRELMAALNDLAPSSRPDAAPPTVRNLPGETA